VTFVYFLTNGIASLHARPDKKKWWGLF